MKSNNIAKILIETIITICCCISCTDSDIQNIPEQKNYNISEAFIYYKDIPTQTNKTLWFKIWEYNLASINNGNWSANMNYRINNNVIIFEHGNFLLYDIKVDVKSVNGSNGIANIYKKDSMSAIWTLIGKNGIIEIIK